MPPPTQSHQPAPPGLLAPQSADEIVARLDEASRRGRLPGFAPRPPGALFRVDAWGTPFDHDLVATADPAGSGTRLSFALRIRRRMPIIHAAILAFTVWPGVWLTDSMLKMWFTGYYHLTQKPIFVWGGFDAFTYLWYLPLCALPLPWYWRSIMRRSRGTSYASALEMIAKIARELGVEPPPEAAEALAPDKPPAP
jgi:hypothetical protein